MWFEWSKVTKIGIKTLWPGRTLHLLCVGGGWRTLRWKSPDIGKYKHGEPRRTQETPVPPPCRKSLHFPCEAGPAGAGPGWEELSLGLRSGFSPPPLWPPGFPPLSSDWLTEGQLTQVDSLHWLLACCSSVQDWWEVRCEGKVQSEYFNCMLLYISTPPHFSGQYCTFSPLHLFDSQLVTLQIKILYKRQKIRA